MIKKGITKYLQESYNCFYWKTTYKNFDKKWLTGKQNSNVNNV